MMNKSLVLSLLFVLLVQQTLCLFGNTTTNNFTISGFSTSAQYVVMEGSGSKLIAWNDKGEIIMSSINGSRLCSANNSILIGQLIWPARYNPIVLLDNGSAFMTFN